MPKRDLKKALEKHKAADVHGHALGPYVQDIVYGGIDGIVTTFAVVAVSAGASLTNTVVIVVGLANLFADASSMGIGAFLSLRSERDQYRRLRKEEEQEIADDPEVEREEIREAYEAKGFKGKDLDRAVDIITSNKEVWIDTMMMEEHGHKEDEDDKPSIHGTITFWSFMVFGVIPLIPYLFNVAGADSFRVAVYSTGLALVVLGLTRSYITRENLLRGPLEILVLGSLAAVVAYYVGYFLRSLGA